MGQGQLILRLLKLFIDFLLFIISLQEFVILMKRRTADTDGTDDIEAAFKVFDTNNDG